MDSVLQNHGVELLRQALNNPEATFRDGQWEAVHHLVYRKGRMLVVQRTGWGKSILYFMATRLLRDQGAGPTLLISPLLALMRNQIQAAERMNLRAATINSANVSEWWDVMAKLQAGKVDILLVSPERLAHEQFCAMVLRPLANKIGLFVVDEAHCISDWGHDFRPDYRRIPKVLKMMPRDMPILATTATANNRVVEDIVTQMASGLVIQRGPLERESLRLQTILLPSQAARLAWLADHLPSISGSGIVYTLTVEDAQRVARFLQMKHINAQPYWGALATEQRTELEQQLLDNEVKALVATSALGMGFDKPDIGFVIHYQRPGSVIHYYQQVGRAGRAVKEAFGILLSGDEDDEITDYFIRTAMPLTKHVEQVLEVLRRAPSGLSLAEIEGAVNIRRTSIEKVLSVLSVESAAPITKAQSKWHANPGAYVYDDTRANELFQIRRTEQSRMQEYMRTNDCLMTFLKKELDDQDASPCGRCANCLKQPLLSESYEQKSLADAERFLRHSSRVITPRKKWPVGAFQQYPFSGLISDALKLEEGRALCKWGDAGWGSAVRRGKQQEGSFPQELVNASFDLIRINWQPRPFPQWVACVPSLNNPTLVPKFAERLARELRLPFIPCVAKVKQTEAQKLRYNSFQQARNLDGVFEVKRELVRPGAVLLMDDMIDSGWTLTVIGALLRQAGSGPVYPYALAVTTSE